MASQNEASILSFVSTHSREKHTTKPMQFGTNRYLRDESARLLAKAA